MTQSHLNLLIIGAGQAAHAAIAELQRQDFGGNITLVGTEPHLPYERPPLSKEVLLNEASELKDIFLQSSDFYADLNINVLLSSTVTTLDTAEKRAVLSDGEMIYFDRCLIATGSMPRILPDLPPNSSPNIHYFRSWDDAVKLKSSLNPQTRVGIIGGGFLGLELASTAQQRGCEVQLFERSERFLPRHAPSVLSNWLKAKAELNQVKLHSNINNIEIHPQGPGFSIQADNDPAVIVDILLVTIGSVAEDHLAREAGIPIHPTAGGILVDEYGKTAINDIFAAGDCTTLADENNAVIRLESWQNANEQGRRAASSMIGNPPEAAAYPWFWTDIFKSNVQMLGHYDPSLSYYTRGDLDPSIEPNQALIIGVKNNIIYHAIAINAARDLRPLRTLLEQKATIDIDQFQDSNVAMRQFSKSTLAANKPVNN